MLSVQIFDSPSLTAMLADFTSRIHPPDGGGMRFSTNEHGFAALELPLVPMTLTEAFEVYDWPGTPHVIVSDPAAGVAWEGRAEDISIVEQGVAITAMGYQRAMRDVPYTALWSDTSSAEWEPVTDTMNSNFQAQRFEMDNNNRLYVALRQGEDYPSTATARGGFTYAIPSESAREITNFSCDYSVKLPTNWIFRVQSITEAWGSASSLNTLTADGTVQTGSLSLTLGTARARLSAYVYNNTGSTAGITVPTGDYYMKLTNLRVKTTTLSTVLASSIADALESYVDGINTLQINGDGALIEATATDLQDELFEDEYPADILDRLALLHDYEWGVWENRRLHFRARGSAGKSWYIDATRITDLQRSLERIRNSAYSVYRDANGRAQRTSAASNTASQERFGVVRRGVVSVQSTSLTEAETHRDVFLADRADAAARADIQFSHLYDEAGAEYPLYALRSGDVVTIRNLSPSLSATVDRIRSFVVAETNYNAATGEMDVTPEEPIPSLERLVARREAGLR